MKFREYIIESSGWKYRDKKDDLKMVQSYLKMKSKSYERYFRRQAKETKLNWEDVEQNYWHGMFADYGVPLTGNGNVDLPNLEKAIVSRM